MNIAILDFFFSRKPKNFFIAAFLTLVRKPMSYPESFWTFFFLAGENCLKQKNCLEQKAISIRLQSQELSAESCLGSHLQQTIRLSACTPSFDFELLLSLLPHIPSLRNPCPSQGWSLAHSHMVLATDACKTCKAIFFSLCAAPVIDLSHSTHTGQGI